MVNLIEFLNSIKIIKFYDKLFHIFNIQFNIDKYIISNIYETSKYNLNR